MAVTVVDTGAAGAAASAVDTAGGPGASTGGRAASMVGRGGARRIDTAFSLALGTIAPIITVAGA